MKNRTFLARGVLALTLLGLTLGSTACKRPRPPATGVSDGTHTGTDPVFQEITAYRYATRMAYNSRRFDELEQRADDARATKAKFSNGSWKLARFYDSLACSEQEPESMWKLHEQIHQAWVAARPASITARVAQMDFFVEYAWHARGSGYADSVTAEGWRVFGERLKRAHEVFDESGKLEAKCPVRWSVGMVLALGEEWSRADYERLYKEGKSYEPTFWGYDTTRSNHLAIKWGGEPGEWETAAQEAAADPRGLGMEIYTRCVLTQFANYKNVFKESKATWARTREGFELMRQRYPESLEVASGYCRLACIAEDQPTAKKLFALLGNNAFSYLWLNQKNLRRDRAWAEGKNSP